MPRPPFTLIPWQDDFLRELLRLIIADTGHGNDLSRTVCIFPHSRPKRYLSLHLYKEPSLRRPLLMPRMHTVSALFSLLSGRILARPAWQAGLLDRVGLLLSCVREEAANSRLPFHTDAKLFFPWGVRLASLFEECFSHMKRPDNFLYAEEQAGPFAALLLSRLGHLFTRYKNALAEREWTTPGYDAMLAAEHLAAGHPLPAGIFADGPVYIAGFHTLTGSEDIIFRRLWEELGARVVLHGDPAAASAHGSEKAHWSCTALTDWAAAWGTRLEPGNGPATGTPRGSSPNTPATLLKASVRYYEGFDLHSQLAALRGELNVGDEEAFPAADAPEATPYLGPADDAPDNAAEDPADDRIGDMVVVLPDSGLLMPVLHHLPLTDINISMGYPLGRSPLFQLVDTLLRLQENRKSSGWYWRDLVALVRHPYIKMLLPQGNEKDVPDEEAAPLRRELRRLEQTLRDNRRAYQNPREALLTLYQTLDADELPPAPVLALLDHVLDVCLDAFAEVSTPQELGEALMLLCGLLLERGAHLWKRFPIDAECLFRLVQSLIPELSRSQLAEEQFTPDTLFTILRSLLEAERVPFEATPLVGMQIMGMLETRLLSFRKVIIVDAVENTLPGSPPGDPLLPEPLRQELGLPPLHGREQIAAYHFFRLLAGAGEAVLFWQEGGDASGIQEQRKKKSRFIEELLWNEEKKQQRLLSTQGRDGPLVVLGSPIAPLPGRHRAIELSGEVRRLMDAALAGSISASLLDAYLRCPAGFYYERLAGLRPPDDIAEGDDPRAVGDLLHTILKDAYVPLLGRALPGGAELAEMLEEELLASLFDAPEYLALIRTLPADSRAMLHAAGTKRLGDYLRRQPPTTVLALETPLLAEFASEGTTYSLFGKADRIDLRACAPASDTEDAAVKDAFPAEGAVVLDYKTGRTPGVSAKLWQDRSLWRAMAAWRPASSASGNSPEPVLDKLAGMMESTQLPLYLLLCALMREQSAAPLAGGSGRPAALLPPATEALWVALSSTGEEVPLLPAKAGLGERHAVLHNHIPATVDFLLRHMRESRLLLPRPGTHCRWCPGAKLCRVSAAPEHL